MNFLTEQKLSNILIGNKEISEWYRALINNLPTFEITTLNRIAAFLAQTAHESNNYKVLQENLNYSVDGLMKVFSKYFNSVNVGMYAKNPEKIANRVYANRIGNGDELSGNGFLYRGRGILQITGKENYGKYSQTMFKDDRLVKNPDLLIQKDNAVKSACCFWKANGLNTFADNSDIITMTKRINGGTIGLQERQENYKKFLEILK
jgi:putative chitinase